VRLLVDTHILLWWLTDDPALPEVARSVMTDGGNELLISAISFAEISIKTSLGKLRAPPDLVTATRDAGFGHLSFGALHATELGQVAWHHRDPFDRMLIAQARVERLTVITADVRFADYQIDLLR
jgi:PIN domain nuclease of toxin-antitoxin system